MQSNSKKQQQRKRFGIFRVTSRKRNTRGGEEAETIFNTMMDDGEQQYESILG